MKHAVFLIGNFGIGKSTLIEPWFGTVPGSTIYTSLSEYEGFEILGTSIGADGLSKYKKADVFSGVLSAGLNLIIAGVYYQQKIDIDRLKATHIVHCIYLNTSKEENMRRVAGRNGKWNEQTYLNKVGAVRVFMEKCLEEGHTVHEIDNDQLPSQTKQEFNDIMRNL